MAGYVKLVGIEQYQIDKGILHSLDVSDDIVAQANIGKAARPHLKLTRLGKDSVQNSNSGKSYAKRPNYSGGIGVLMCRFV